MLNKDTNLVYGEVEFDSFVDILSKIDVKPGSKFLDLGSGTGKAVYAAAMLRDFAHVCGIEYLESLHNTAVKLLPKFEKLQDDNGLVLDEDTPEIVFHHGSFLDDRFDLSDYDVSKRMEALPFATNARIIGRRSPFSFFLTGSVRQQHMLR